MTTDRGSVTAFRGRWRVRATIDGERVSLGVYERRADADAVLAEALRQASPGAGLTLRGWGERWLRARATDGLHRAQHKATSAWATHVAAADFIDWPIRRIKRTDVVRWVRDLLKSHALRTVVRGRGTRRTVERIPTTRKLSRQTVINALALLRRSLTDAADEGHVRDNVAAGVSVPKVPRTDEPWTWLRADEVTRLLACALPPERRAIFTVAIFTGCRAGELWGLRWADVKLDGDAPELVVRHSYRDATKAGVVRRVPLLRQAREALEAWRRERPGLGAALVFPADGGGCHAEGYDAGLRTWLRRAGVTRDVRFHDLRHTCGSHLVAGTWGPPMRLEDVRQWLGHASVTTTERYAHLDPAGIAALARRIDGADTARTQAEPERKRSRRK